MATRMTTLSEIRQTTGAKTNSASYDDEWTQVKQKPSKPADKRSWPHQAPSTRSNYRSGDRSDYGHRSSYQSDAYEKKPRKPTSNPKVRNFELKKTISKIMLDDVGARIEGIRSVAATAMNTHEKEFILQCIVRYWAWDVLDAVYDELKPPVLSKTHRTINNYGLIHWVFWPNQERPNTSVDDAIATIRILFRKGNMVIDTNDKIVDMNGIHVEDPEMIEIPDPNKYTMKNGVATEFDKNTKKYVEVEDPMMVEIPDPTLYRKETVIDSLKGSMRSSQKMSAEGKVPYLTDADYAAIYHRLTHLEFMASAPEENNVSELAYLAQFVNNRMSDRNVESFTVLVNFIAQSDPRALADQLIREALAYKKGTRSRNITYDIVETRIDAIMQMLSIDPSADSQFDSFFEENPWNPEANRLNFASTLCQQCNLLDIAKYKSEEDAQSLENNFEAIAALVGSIGRLVPGLAKEFIHRCFQANYVIPAIYVMTHMKQILPDELNHILRADVFDTLIAKKRFEILDAIKYITNSKRDVSREEAIVLCRGKVPVTASKVEPKTVSKVEPKAVSKTFVEIDTAKIATMIINALSRFDGSDMKNVGGVFSPECIDDAAYTLSTMPKGYNADALLSQLLEQASLRYSDAAHMNAFVFFGENCFGNFGKLLLDARDQLLDNATYENPQAVHLLNTMFQKFE